MTGHYFNPLDPMGEYYFHLPDNLTEKEREELERISRRIVVRVSVVFLVMLVALAVVSVLSGCSSAKETTSLEQHRVETMVDRMDSILSARTVISQDSTWRELVMSQFQSIREKSDTSHTMVVDTAGRVIKETLIIRTEKESSSERESQERQVMIHRLDVMDSTLSVMRAQLAHSDSLISSTKEETVKEVEKPLSWWQQARLWLANIVLVALAVLAAAWIIRKKTTWIRR